MSELEEEVFLDAQGQEEEEITPRRSARKRRSTMSTPAVRKKARAVWEKSWEGSGLGWPARWDG